MTRVKLKHIHRFKDRHGVERHYLRIPGRESVALKGEPGSPEFMATYSAAVQAAQAAKPVGSGAIIKGSFDDLCVSFYASSKFKGLKPGSQGPYRRIIESMRAANGKHPVRLINDAVVRKLMDEKQGKPNAANHRLRLLRHLMQHAIKIKLRADDPTKDIEKHAYDAGEGYRAWGEDHIAQYEARWPSGTLQRRAFTILLYTGQRRSDAVLMGRQHVRDNMITLRQVKTGNPVTVPIHEALAVELAQAPPGRLTFLAVEGGSPRSPRGFYNSFSDWCREAALPPGLSPHGLRKATGRRLAEAGCSAHEIMAILGHKTLAEAQRYTEAADRKRLSQSAMGKIAHLGKVRTKEE